MISDNAAFQSLSFISARQTTVTMAADYWEIVLVKNYGMVVLSEFSALMGTEDTRDNISFCQHFCRDNR